MQNFINNSKLPSGWRWVRLGDVLESIESGSRPKGGVFEIKEGIPSIGAEHLNSFGGFDFGNMRFIPKEFYEGMRRGRIQKGDVLVVKDGATTGKVAFVGDDFPYTHAAVNEHVFRLRGKEFLAQEFLFWFLYSPLGQTQIQQEFHGAAQGGINQQFVNGVYVPIPSLPVQHRIASKLQELMQEVERARTACEKQLETAKALPAAYLREVFESEEAKKWERKKLGEVIRFSQSGIWGDDPEGAPLEVKFPVFRSTEIDHRGNIRLDSETIAIRRIKKEIAEKYFLLPGDLLIVRSGGTTGKIILGRVGMFNGESNKYLFSNFLLRIRLNEELADPNYLWFYLNWDKFLEDNIPRLMRRTTGIQNLPMDDYFAIRIPLPPIEVQHHIASELKEKMTEVKKLRTQIEKQLEAINALPQAILRKAFRGQL